MSKLFDGVEYITMEEHRRVVDKLEHLIHGMNEEILEEAQEIHHLQDDLNVLQDKLDDIEYDKIGV